MFLLDDKPGVFVAAFTPASGGQALLDDLGVTVASALTAHALNVGFTPVITPGVAALTRHRISHVDQSYLRAETYAADLLRLAGSIHTGAVSAHDVLRMLAHGGNPTQLGEALAHDGRSSRPCTCCRMSIRPRTGRRSRACATCRKAATTWPGTSSTAAAVLRATGSQADEPTARPRARAVAAC